jgi:DMSO/TMAO reductase YedYZ heme-binding membrane subunit
VHYFWAVKQDVVEPVVFSVLLVALLAARRWPPRAPGESTAG